MTGRPKRSGPTGPTPSGTASSLHAFNRYEVKYLVDRAQVARLRELFRERLDADAHDGGTGYPVTSVYYDTDALRFYWEKIEGLRFRRKLRMRVYGPCEQVADDSPVFVEIKQRVNRVTQKRRIALPYDRALDLCAGRAVDGWGEMSRRATAFVDEVSSLVLSMHLKPMVTTSYHREAYVGRDADLGLRVTIDHRLRGRDRDFRFGSPAVNRLTLPPEWAVLEVKANERMPTWVTDATARMNLSVVRISKYCHSVQAFGLAPRPTMHRREDGEDVLADAVASSLAR